MIESGVFYSIVIDPLLKQLRRRVARQIKTGERVIDIACGTGAQAIEIAGSAAMVTGVDLSESMIKYAIGKAAKQNLLNTNFVVGDATNLSAFYNQKFDVAILSMALHQFHPDQQIPILNEIKKVANRIIILDYTVPLPKNYAGVASKVAEFLAGVDHNRNFRSYSKSGGLNSILPLNGLEIQKSSLLGKGAFHLVVAKIIN